MVASASGIGNERSQPLAVAEQLLAAGLSFIPIRADGSKAPDGRVLPRVPKGPNGQLEPSWTPYQHRLPTLDEANHWFADGTRGIAALGGAVDGLAVCLEAIDFDKIRYYLSPGTEAKRSAELDRTNEATPQRFGV